MMKKNFTQNKSQNGLTYKIDNTKLVSNTLGDDK